jgi:hypothetical protein
VTELHPLLAKLAQAGAYEPPSAPPRPQNGSGRVAAPPPPGDPQAARYAAAALEREAANVAGTPEGGRNHQLNTSAFRMGQLVACGWLVEQNAFDTLVNAGMAAGLPYPEAERTVLSGLDGGKRAPRDGVELHPAPPPPAYVVANGTRGLPEGDEGALRGDRVFAGSHAVVTETGEPATPPRPRQLVDGGVFIHSARADVPALWGEGDDVLWSAGEPLIITGPTGVGKTTLGTCVVAGRLGFVPDVLGYPVTPGDRKTLVLAMDRPRQIQRAMARLLRRFPEDALNERLIVWEGPPPMDLARHPHLLLQLAELADADTVVIDSLKDAAVKLSDEETGQGISRAMNYCVSQGVEVLTYHHQRKHSASAQGKPKELTDVYGSHWITAGAGSIILLWGSAGDLVIELSHLKQPAGVVGPLSVGHDHEAGRSFLYDGMSEGDKVMDLLASGPQTAAAVASWLWGDGADRAAVMRAKRRLDRLVETGVAIKLDEKGVGVRRDDGRIGGSTGGRYRLVASHTQPRGRLVAPTHAPIHATDHADSRLSLEVDVSAGRTGSRPDPAVDLVPPIHANRHADSRETTNPQVAPNHAPIHADSRDLPAPPIHAPKPPFRGGVGGVRTRVGDPTPFDSHEVEVCARCHREAERLIPAPHGRRWCPECAYPTEPFEKEDK